jgi:hypothetical protein
MSQPTKVNQAAFDIGQMTERMAQGYATHVAAIQTGAGIWGQRIKLIPRF